jgi:predicted phage terminase large subunit-like protein
MTSEWYQNKWGDHVELKVDENGKEYYVNIKTGWRKSSSCKSGLTGYRGDRLLLDDPHSVKGGDSDAEREETLRWFAETLPTRLNNANESVIIVIMQRVNENDVSGLIIAEELGYEHLMLPMEYEPERCCYSIIKPKYIQVPKKEIVLWDKDSHSWKASKSQNINEDGAEVRWKADPRVEDGELLWPDRFNEDAVESLKKALRSHGGGYAEAGQLQQRPAPRGGGMFKLGDWQYCDASDVPKGGREVRGWDLAATDSKTNKNAAYTACGKVKIVDGSVYILDVKRKQEGPAGAEAMFKMVADEDGKRCIQDFPQDPGQAGKAQRLSICKVLQGYDFKCSPETGSKKMRATPLAAQVENKNVYLVRGHWNSDFTKEASMFPTGKFKDQIDAVTRAYHRCLMAPKTMSVAGGGVID